MRGLLRFNTRFTFISSFQSWTQPRRNGRTVYEIGIEYATVAVDLGTNVWVADFFVEFDSKLIISLLPK